MKEQRQILINYGLIMGLVMVAMNAVLYATGNYNLAQSDANVWLSIFNITVSVLFPVMGILKIKTLNGGFISFGQAFKSAFTVILFSAIIGAAWLLVYTIALEPNYQEAMIQNTYEQLEKSGQEMSEADMDNAIAMTKKFSTPWFMAGFAILTSAFFGALISLLVAAVLQKKSPEQL